MFGGEEQNTSQGRPLPRDGVVLHPEEQTPDAGRLAEASWGLQLFLNWNIQRNNHVCFANVVALSL